MVGSNDLNKLIDWYIVLFAIAPKVSDAIAELNAVLVDVNGDFAQLVKILYCHGNSFSPYSR